MFKQFSMFVAAVSLLGACGSDAGGGAGSGSAKASGSAAAKTSAAPAKSAAATATASAVADAPKAEMVEKELDKVAAFKGWVAKGPADADVMEDLGGVRIATKKVMGPGSFDLAFKLGKGDFKPFKDGLVKGAEITKSKITFISDTPESLEWTSEAGTSKTYSFRLSLKAGKDEYTCYTVSPRESEAEYKAHKEACSTLMKKADAKK